MQFRWYTPFNRLESRPGELDRRQKQIFSIDTLLVSLLNLYEINRATIVDERYQSDRLICLLISQVVLPCQEYLYNCRIISFSWP